LLASDQAIDPRTFTSKRDVVQRLWAAAYMADGLIVAAERALALPACVREANTWIESAPTRQRRLMSLSGPLSSNTVLFWQGGAPCVLILHHRHAQWRKQMEMIQARLPDGFLLPEAVFQQADIT